MPTYQTPSVTVELQREGEGRYRAYILAPSGGRIYVGQVLGGGRVWSAELVGSRITRRSNSRPTLARSIADWAVQQSGLVAAGAANRPQNRAG